MDKFLLVIIAVLSMFFVHSCSTKNREIRDLNSEVIELKADRPYIWVESCKTAVYRTCFYADCDVTPIEIIQEKVCKIQEEQ